MKKKRIKKEEQLTAFNFSIILKTLNKIKNVFLCLLLINLKREKEKELMVLGPGKRQNREKECWSDEEKREEKNL